MTPCDYFISYNKADRAWAEWLAWQLEAESYTTIIQAWDFRPGTNFVAKMQEAATTATRTIAVLSPDYLNDAPYSAAEWMAAFAQDPTGKNATLLPVRIRECDPSGLLKAIVYIDLVDLDEQEARTIFLAGIKNTRAKPTTPSRFPGKAAPAPPRTLPPNFPGKWPLQLNIPYTRNPFFTGRETLLLSLRDQLLSGNTMALTQTQAISGLGGIGKTQTAIEYAYRHQQQYSYILWVGAATIEALLSDLSRLADLLNVPGRDPQNQQNTANAVKTYLSQQRDWLLIFDNADDIAMVRPYLPLGNKTNGHIILTTRADALGPVAHTIQVQEMDKEEGTQLLLKRGRLLKTGQLPPQVKASERDVAASIVAAVGGLPLALDQAASYIEETGCSLSEYLELYQTRHQDLLKRRGKLITGHPETVATTWSLAFQNVEQENEAAAELLRLCAFLAPDAIPIEIIREGAPELGNILAPVAADPLYLNEAIAVLRKYSLVKRDAETKTLSIHRLVQQVLKDGMNERVQRQWAERAVQAVNSVFPYGWDLENWPQCRRLLAQAQVCEELIAQYDLVFAEAARLLLWCGYYLYQQALYVLAEPFFLHSLSIAEKLDNSEYPKTFDIQHGLGMLYREQGKYIKAEGFFGKSLSAAENVFGREHPNTSATQHELARLYQAQGKYPEAEELYRESLATKKKILGKEHPNTATTQHELARLYQAQGNYSEAEELYREALATTEKMLGREHPNTATTQHELARLYQAQGKYPEAEELYRGALATKEKMLGKEHPDTAMTQHELARLYQAQGNYSEAEELYREALATTEKMLGREHPNTATTQHELARLYQAQGNYSEAEELYREALITSEKMLGREHPDTATTQHELARLYQNQGNYSEAEELYREALITSEKMLGREHPDTAATQHELARLYQNQGNYSEAEELYREALATREKMLGREHPDTIISIESYASLLREMNRPAEAEALEARIKPQKGN